MLSEQDLFSMRKLPPVDGLPALNTALAESSAWTDAGYSLTPSTVAMATKYRLLCNLIADICLMKEAD